MFDKIAGKTNSTNRLLQFPYKELIPNKEEKLRTILKVGQVHWEFIHWTNANVSSLLAISTK